MRMILLIAATLTYSSAALADDPIWFVAVYGENMQLISGASSTPDVEDGVFLGTDYAGTEIYVRTKQGYELDGFRPAEDSSGAAQSYSSSESTMDAAAAASEAESEPVTEFGPLTDTGVQYYINGDYFGWFCSELFVKPMGNGVDRLRCDEEMNHAR